MHQSETIHPRASTAAASPSAATGESAVTVDRLKQALGERLLVNEVDHLHKFADQAKANLQFREMLFEIIEASKTHDEVAIAAANAITILNATGVPFSDRDWNGIQVPGADLSGAWLAGCQLRYANLQGARLAQAYLGNADLEGTHLAEVDFGQLPLLKHENGVRSLAYSPNGRWLATGDYEGYIQVWDLKSGTISKTLRNSQIGMGGDRANMNNLQFHPKEPWLVVGSKDGQIRLWDVSKGELLHTFEGHKNSINSVSLSADGRWLASAGGWDNVRLWSMAERRLVHTFEKHTGTVNSVAFSGDGRWLASGSADSRSGDNTVRLWSVAERRLVHTFEGHRSWLRSVAFSADGRWLASAGDWDNTVRLWSVAERRLVHTFEGHTGTVNSVAFSGDGRWLASGSEDNTVRLWSVAERQAINTFVGHTHWVASVSFSGDGRWLVSGSEDKTVRWWLVAERRLVRAFERYTNTCDSNISTAFSADGCWLASGEGSYEVRLRSVAGRKLVHTFEGHTSWVGSVAFSVDGLWLASGSHDNTVRLWSVADRKEVHVFTGHTGEVTSVSFSADGRFLASGSEDGTVRLWSVADRQLVHTFRRPIDVYSVALSGDGCWLAVGGSPRNSDYTGSTVQLLSVAKRRLVHTFEWHSSVNSMAFSDDGRWLASGSEDNTVRLWDVTTGQAIATFSMTYTPLAFYWHAAGQCLRVVDRHLNHYLYQLSHDASQCYLREVEGTWPLTLEGVNIQGAIGLSLNNQQLLQQLGAVGTPAPKQAVYAKALTAAAAPGPLAASATVAPMASPEELIPSSLLTAAVAVPAASSPENVSVNIFNKISSISAASGMAKDFTPSLAAASLPAKPRASAGPVAVAATADPSLPSPRTSRASVLDASGNFSLSIAIAYQDLMFGKELGRGSFGIVYQGEYQYSEAAIKQLNSSHLPEDVLAEFQREVAIMASLRSPYVVQLYGACFESPHYALVMEYLPKGSLYQLLSSKAEVTWNVCYQIGVDISCGLAYLHKQGIIHGDIKSLNVLLDDRYRAKLCDFGLAKVKLTSSQATAAGSGASGGSVRWMAPELFKRGAKNTKASDVYSYACVLWELGARKVPFAEEPNDRIPYFVKEGDREIVTADTPPKMAALIARCWDGRAEARPAMDEAVKELREEQKARFGSA